MVQKYPVVEQVLDATGAGTQDSAARGQSGAELQMRPLMEQWLPIAWLVRTHIAPFPPQSGSVLPAMGNREPKADANRIPFRSYE